MVVESSDSPWNEMYIVRPNDPSSPRSLPAPRRSLFDTGVKGPFVIVSVIALVIVSTLIELVLGWTDYAGWFLLVPAKMGVCAALWNGAAWARWIAPILMWISALADWRVDHRRETSLSIALLYCAWILGGLLIALPDVKRFMRAQRQGRPYLPKQFVPYLKIAIGSLLIIVTVAVAYCTPIIRAPLYDTKFSSKAWIEGDVQIRGRMVRNLNSSHGLYGKSDEEVRALLGVADRTDYAGTMWFKVDLGYRWIINPYLYDLIIRFDKGGRVFQVDLKPSEDG